MNPLPVSCRACVKLCWYHPESTAIKRETVYYVFNGVVVLRKMVDESISVTAPHAICCLVVK